MRTILTILILALVTSCYLGPHAGETLDWKAHWNKTERRATDLDGKTRSDAISSFGSPIESRVKNGRGKMQFRVYSEWHPLIVTFWFKNGVITSYRMKKEYR